jgi:type II secretion system protein C
VERQGVAFVPHRENGEVTGLRFSGGASGSLFDHLGLRHGDILQSINGYSMNDPEEGLRAYAMLRRAPLLRVKLLREGRPVELVIHVM